MICDGTYQPKLTTERGGAGWIIECKDTNQRMIGYIPTTSKVASAYKLKLTGIYAGLAMIHATTILHKVTIGSIHIFCDNERAIYLSNNNTPRIHIKMKHTDVLRIIKHTQSQMPIIHTSNIFMVIRMDTKHMRNQDVRNN